MTGMQLGLSGRYDALVQFAHRVIGLVQPAVATGAAARTRRAVGCVILGGRHVLSLRQYRFRLGTVIWYEVLWLLDVCLVIMVAIGYFAFTRKANRISVPDLTPPENLDGLPIWLDTLVLHQERLDERLALRRKAIRWGYLTMAVGVVTVLLSAIHLLAVVL